MASPNYSELLTTTIESRTGTIRDNVTANNALLTFLNDRGGRMVRPFTGGSTIMEELSFQANSTAMFYSGSETLDIAPQEVLTSANYSMKQAAVAVTITGAELLQNAGKEQIIDLMEARISNAEGSLENLINTGLYSDGTGYSGKQIGGLQLLVADTPTSGTVGGINRATYSWWRNTSYDATTDGGAAATTSNIQSYMNTVYSRLVRGKDAPDLILADNNYFNLYLGSLQAIQRITDVNNKASAGFRSLAYLGGNADVILENSGLPANHMYFLNTKFLHYRPHKDRDMVPLDPATRASVNQDAIVKLIGWAGNLTMSGAKFQGLLKD